MFIREIDVMNSLVVMLEKKSLNTKFLLAIGYGLLIMSLIGINIVSSLNTLSTLTNNVENDLVDITHIREANTHLLKINKYIHQLIDTQRDVNSQVTLNELINQSLIKVREEVALVKNDQTDDIDKIKWGDFEFFFNDYQNAIKQIVERIQNQKKEDTSIIVANNHWLYLEEKTENILLELSQRKEIEASHTIQNLQIINEKTIIFSSILMLIGLFIVSLSSFLVSKAIVTPIRRIQTVIENLADGKLNEVIPHVNDKNEIGAIARAFIILQSAYRKMESQRWVKEHFANISTQLHQVETFENFANKFLSSLCPIIDAGYASFYHYKENELHLLGSYGGGIDTDKNSIPLGKGLVGQCASEKRTIKLNTIPNNYVKISSSLGESIPNNIIVYPVLRLNRLLGVIEIALFTDLSEAQEILLKELMPMVAISMDILDRNVQTHILLDETQIQAHNLEMQSAKLEEQEVELQMQQAEIKEAEAWFRGIIESAPDAMLVVDEEGNIVLCNKQADEIFGYASGELLHQNIDCLVPISVRERHPSMRNKFMSEGGTREMGAKMDLHATRKDGSEFGIEVGLSRLPTNNNKIFVCVSARDVSSKKEAEAALYSAKKIAEESTQMKSDFLANMSHEIRTPMNAIIGISHLIAKTQLTEKQNDYIKKIQISSQHLLNIINDILDLSKIESGKILLEQIDFKIEKVLNNVLNLIDEKAKDKQIEIIFDIDHTLPLYLNGDPLRLGQILVNYANNAVKFTDEGEIIIRVKVIEDNVDEVFLHFSVSDTGIGLSQESIEKLFRDFQQADTSTSRKYGGSGLGLSISKKLTDLMNGEVGVESVLGKGSNFWFTARLKKASKNRSPYAMPSKNLTNRRVLIVDDNEISRYELENMLSNIGLVVTQIATGEKALKYITMADSLNEPYELVFLDWYMPDMDGAETAKAIMELPLKHSPRIIMVTAHGREEVLKEFENAGLEDVLIKPVNISLLFDAVIRILGDQDTLITTEITPDEELKNLTDILEQLKTLQGANILLAEDNVLNQEVALGLLCDEGINVNVANDGREVLYMIDKQHYDVVLMDMQMPVMDGIATTIEIRKQVRFNSLPIIAMTANAMQQDKENCFESGMNDYISKPINPEVLYRTLLKWIHPKNNYVAKNVNNSSPAIHVDDALPEMIDGLDVRLGLSRVVGKKILYLNMLQKYSTNQKDIIPDLRNAIITKDYKTAERIAHSTKSVNGNIGAMELHDLAQDIEILIRTASPLTIINEKIDQFALLQHVMITSLTEYFAVSPLVQKAIVDQSKLKAILERLESYLTDDDAETLEFFDYNRENLKIALDKESFEEVEIAINLFNFEHALKLIKKTKGYLV